MEDFEEARDCVSCAALAVERLARPGVLDAERQRITLAALRRLRELDPARNRPPMYGV